MPASYEIDPNRKLVTSRLWDPVTEDELNDHNQRLRTDPAFDPAYRQLVDMTGLTEILVSTKTINQTSIDHFFNPGTLRAFVASSDAIFGMSRKFALQSEGAGQTIHVFRDLRSAEDWLGLTPPKAPRR
jgi:hypothetical protein